MGADRMGGAMRVGIDVLAVLSAAEISGAALALTGTLDRKLYVSVNKVLEAAGGKWNRKARAHVFAGDAADAIEPILLSGEVTDAKKEFGAFFSPPAVVDRLMALADVRPEMRALEPSAGNGAIARRLVAAEADVTCVEILPANVVALRAAGLPSIIEGDFLATVDLAPMDRIVMNPPFAKRADINHVRHAMRFLKPGGRLVSVMSAGVKFRDDGIGRDFRTFVEQHSGTIEDLPDDSFAEAGTRVNAVIVTMDAAGA